MDTSTISTSAFGMPDEMAIVELMQARRAEQASMQDSALPETATTATAAPSPVAASASAGLDAAATALASAMDYSSRPAPMAGSFTHQGFEQSQYISALRAAHAADAEMRSTLTGQAVNMLDDLSKAKVKRQPREERAYQQAVRTRPSVMDTIAQNVAELNALKDYNGNPIVVPVSSGSGPVLSTPPIPTPPEAGPSQTAAPAAAAPAAAAPAAAEATAAPSPDRDGQAAASPSVSVVI